MNTITCIAVLLFSTASGKFLPRAPLKTLTVAIPTQAAPLTTTIRGCSDVDPFVVIAAGTVTIYGPPQADPTTTTVYDTVQNATEVIIFTKLQGDCASFPIPDPPATSVSGTGVASSSPTPSADVCPENGCQAKVIRAAQSVIDAINKVTLLSQSLQAAARRIGEPVKAGKRDDADALAPFDDVGVGLKQIAVTLSVTIPRITVLAPFPPGCDTDAIVIALIQFVRVHQALLNIIIGRRGFLEQSPIKREVANTDLALMTVEKRDQNAIIGPAIAAGLRAVEGVVDALAFQILRLIPTRSECAKQQKEAIDATLFEAITQYEN